MKWVGGAVIVVFLVLLAVRALRRRMLLRQATIHMAYLKSKAAPSRWAKSCADSSGHGVKSGIARIVCRHILSYSHSSGPYRRAAEALDDEGQE